MEKWFDAKNVLLRNEADERHIKSLRKPIYQY